MDPNGALEHALDSWLNARDKLAAFEAIHLTMYLIAHESHLPIHPAELPPDIVREWRAAALEESRAYLELLDLMAEIREPT